MGAVVNIPHFFGASCAIESTVGLESADRFEASQSAHSVSVHNVLGHIPTASHKGVSGEINKIIRLNFLHEPI